jgi:glycosyltransferase involved in cell wall biosynthesis
VAAEPARRVENGPDRPVRVLHVITRMIVGGAQLNTLLSCTRIDRTRFPSEILTGPETGAEGELISEARAQGVPVHVEPWLVRRVAPLHDAIALARMVRFMRRGRYDVVHTHVAKAGVLGRLAARLAGVPVVVHTAHGFWITFAQSPRVSWAYIRLERFGTGLTDAVVSVSDTITRQLLAHGIGSAAQYTTLRSGIELERFAAASLDRAAARRRLDLPGDAFVVGSVGRLSPQKAPLDLIRAFAALAGRRPEAHLVVVGDGPLRTETETEASRLGLENRVRFLGLRRDMPEILGALDALVLVSRYEGLPRVVPEAMAAGLPVVATDVDGTSEAVAHGETGFLVPSGDVARVAAALESLAADPASARLMGERARERAAAFSIDVMVAGLERLYAELCKRSISSRSSTA